MIQPWRALVVRDMRTICQGVRRTLLVSPFVAALLAPSHVCSAQHSVAPGTKIYQLDSTHMLVEQKTRAYPQFCSPMMAREQRFIRHPITRCLSGAFFRWLEADRV
jgi:hypothetical protein